jgi:hypothetical protein
MGPLASGITWTLRGSALPLLVGWRVLRPQPHAGDTPSPRWGLGLASKAALDEAFFATELVTAPLLALSDRRRVLRETAQALSLSRRRGWLDDPAGYHAPPPPLVRFALDERRSGVGRYLHLRFESGYAPHRGEPGRARWLARRANRTAHAWLLQHPGPPRPWLVCVPGYRMGGRLVDFVGFRARFVFERLGVNVAIPVMPLHGPRREGRRGGDGFLTGDFVDTVHAQAQAVWDVRRLVGWLRAGGAPAVGVHGVSLGGHTVGLLAALDGELDCAIAGIPAVDFARLVRRLAPRWLLAAAARHGLGLDRVERLLRVVSPLAMPPRVPREARFVYAGTADRLATPDHARDLWEHWERPRIAWFEGSHVSFFLEPEVRALVLGALAARGLLPASVARAVPASA